MEKRKMEKILAKVGALTVTEEDVNTFILNLGQRGQGYNTPEGRKMILEQLIADRLLLQDARRNLLEAEPEYKAELAKLKDTLLINYAGNKIISAVSVTDQEAESFYNQNPDKFKEGDRVNASHILTDTEEKAIEILDKIKRGELSFEEAAQEYSSCPSKENGGSLGDFGRGQMVPEFDKAVFEMEVGAISEKPVATQFGFHIIKLNAKTEGRIMEFDEVKVQLKNSLLNEKQHNAYQSKINQLKIMYPVDLV